MTTILLCLVLYGLLMFAAGLRCAVVLRERRADRRPGYLPLTLTGYESSAALAHRTDKTTS